MKTFDQSQGIAEICSLEIVQKSKSEITPEPSPQTSKALISFLSTWVNVLALPPKLTIHPPATITRFNSAGSHPGQDQHGCVIISQCQSPLSEASRGLNIHLVKNDLSVQIMCEIINLWNNLVVKPSSTIGWQVWSSEIGHRLVRGTEKNREGLFLCLTLAKVLAFFLPQVPVRNELLLSLPSLSSWEWV